MDLLRDIQKKDCTYLRYVDNFSCLYKREEYSIEYRYISCFLFPVFEFLLFLFFLKYIVFYIGILIIFSEFQWLAGLITFLFPGLASHLKSSYLPVHIFFGLMIFVCACATALLGITEKAIFGLG